MGILMLREGLSYWSLIGVASVLEPRFTRLMLGAADICVAGEFELMGVSAFPAIAKLDDEVVVVKLPLPVRTMLRHRP